MQDFSISFSALTGNDPFPWQKALYERFIAGEIPSSCNLPTGLGKTSVVAVWLIALATHPEKMPRRLVYVVNRRTVVDQTTDEAEKIRRNLKKVPELENRLWNLCALKREAKDTESYPLALSTLRGQFADNREWSADPARPAVIVGTVDMIGSRLLFSGYGLGFRTRPLHAGFLGQDSLLVHDEAHLEPAFQKLLTAIETEQHQGERIIELPWPKMRVVELTATSRGKIASFGLTPEDHENPVVRMRVRATKAIELTPIGDEKKELVDRMVKLAIVHDDQDRAVIIFARSVVDAVKIAAKLPEERVRSLTGTMRGLERESKLVKHPVFQRFLPESNRDKNVPAIERTVYLVCTSAGEVGVNLSADDLVCDLSTFESMAQRFGRVNRFGFVKSTRIDIVHPQVFKDDEFDVARRRTLALLHLLGGDGSPLSLGELTKKHADEIRDAYSPQPQMLNATDMLFDAWALTTIRERLPGRPSVEPYLHGLPNAWEPPETQIAWRKDVELLTPEILAADGSDAEDALELYPLKPHELLRDRSDRVFQELQKLEKRLRSASSSDVEPSSPHCAWLIDDSGRVEVVKFADLVDKDRKERINERTILLPPSVGGLTVQGTLDGDEARVAYDVADEWYADAEQTEHRRRRVTNEVIGGDWRLIRSFELSVDVEDEDHEPTIWNWYERPIAGDSEGSKYADRPVFLNDHVEQVERYVREIVKKSKLPESLRDTVILAARYHDLGKARLSFQRILGNTDMVSPLAKSGKRMQRFDQDEHYRHEFGSLNDVAAKIASLPESDRDLVLHLIAAHHGRARPHFPTDEVFDPSSNTSTDAVVAADVPRRFARLQRRYGRWGLAYLESLLRAADYAASSNPRIVEENVR